MTQSILAGFLIGIGDIAIMLIANQYLAAFLFCVALMCVIYFKLPLYTGRIGYAPWNKNWAGYFIALIFNVIGSTFAVWLFTLIHPDNIELVKTVATAKYVGRSYLVLFIAGVFCNILIHLACATKHSLIVIMCVMVFILCGFEHSVASIPYAIFGHNYLYLIGWVFILIGNTVGGIATEWMLRFTKIDDSYNSDVDIDNLSLGGDSDGDSSESE